MIKSYRSRVDRRNYYTFRKEVRNTLKLAMIYSKNIWNKYIIPGKKFELLEKISSEYRFKEVYEQNLSLVRNGLNLHTTTRLGFEPGEVAIFTIPGLMVNKSDMLGSELRIHQIKNRQSLNPDSNLVFDSSLGKLIEE